MKVIWSYNDGYLPQIRLYGMITVDLVHFLMIWISLGIATVDPTLATLNCLDPCIMGWIRWLPTLTDTSAWSIVSIYFVIPSCLQNSLPTKINIINVWPVHWQCTMNTCAWPMTLIKEVVCDHFCYGHIGQIRCVALSPWVLSATKDAQKSWGK